MAPVRFAFGVMEHGSIGVMGESKKIPILILGFPFQYSLGAAVISRPK